MSYDDDRREGYSRADPREYGGGGSSGANYYDENQRFDDGSQGGYQRDDERRNERQDDYGRGGEESYGRGGDDDERRSGRRYDEGQGGGPGESYGSQSRYDDDERRPERRHDGEGYSQGDYGGRPEQRYEGDNYGDSGRPQRRHDDGYGGGSGGYGDGGADFDQDEVLKHSRQHGDSGDFDLFSSALSFLNNSKSSAQQEGLDEGRVQQSHQMLYEEDSGGRQHDASSLGAGAAMHALKMFAGGSGSQGAASGGQAQMISMAMQEAAKLFDKQNNQGNVASGTDKQSAINQAAKFALQMYMKGQSGGSGGSSGAGNLMSLASKFFQ